MQFNITLDLCVITVEHGWWFPVKEAAEPTLFGVFDSNMNNLTSQCQNGETSYGAPVKYQIAEVYKCTEENKYPLLTGVVTRQGGFNYVK